MASLKVIRRRIVSFKTTQKTTQAMKLVSAANLRRAQEALVNARPFSESLARIADSLLASERGMVAAPADAKPVALLVVIASDRGLCGAFNINVARKAEEAVRNLKSAGIQPEIFAIGRKLIEHFKRTHQPMIAERTGVVPRIAGLSLSQEIAKLILSRFRAGEISEAGVVYSHFKSALSQQPVYEKILPVSDTEKSAAQHQNTIEYLIEPSRKELVATVLQSYVETKIFFALLENAASEHGARMSAMEAATNNAKEIIESLTLDMNRARQATITRELMDIVGGAEALRG